MLKEREQIRIRLAVWTVIIGIIVVSMSFWSTETHAAKVPKVSFVKKAVSIYKGQTVRLKTKIKNKKKNTKLVYQSKNKKVVSVDKKGRIKGKKAGTAVIKVRIKGKKATSSCKVTVGEYVKAISLTSAKTVVLYQGKTSQIRAAVLPKKALQKNLVYHSSDSKIVSVSSTGVIRGLEAGIAKVQVISAGSTQTGQKVSDVVTVIVLENKVEQPTPTTPAESNPTESTGGKPTDPTENNPTEPTESSPTGPTESDPTESTGSNPTDPTESDPTESTGSNPTDPTESDPTESTGSNPTDPTVSNPTESTGSNPTDPTVTEPETSVPTESTENVIPSTPDPTKALVWQGIRQEGNETYTVYLLNKAYTGTIQLVFGEKSWIREESVSECLNYLVNEYIIYTSTGRNMKISRKAGEEYWKIYDLDTSSTVPAFEIKAYMSDPYYQTQYGVIIAKGDTRNRIFVQ